MKASKLEYIYGFILLVIFGGIVLHAPISVMMSTIFPSEALFIKSWKELLLILLVPIVVVVLIRHKMVRIVLNDWIMRLIIIYSLLHILLAMIIGGDVISMGAGLAIDLRYLLFFALVYIFIKIAPDKRNIIVLIATIGAFIVVFFATLQIFLPYDILANIGYNKNTIIPYLVVDQNFDFIRVNSTLRGPNPLGAYAGIVIAVYFAAVIYYRKILDKKHLIIPTVLFGIFATTALWVSYSRSALVAACVAVVIVVLLSLKNRQIIYRTVIIAITVVGFIAGTLYLGGFKSEFISNVLLHKNPDSSALTGSNEGHIDSIETGVQRLIHQPLGGGIGSTGSASLHGDEPIIIENQYLFVAHESGWFGLALFLLIFGMILVRLFKRRRDWLALGLFASGIGLAMIGMLLPVWADDTVAMIWFGLAAVVVAGKENYGYPKTNKKTTRAA